MRRLAAITLILCAAPAATGDAARQSSQGRIVFASERGSTLEKQRALLGPCRREQEAGAEPQPERGRLRREVVTGRDADRLREWATRARSSGRRAVRHAKGRPGGLRRLTPRGFEVAIDVVPDWSPDGWELTLTGKRGSRSGVWTIHADGRRLRFLARGTNAAWSPSGDRVVFTALNGISVVSAAGGRARRLTHGPNDSTPAWSPDGRGLGRFRALGCRRPSAEARPCTGLLAERCVGSSAEGMRTSAGRLSGHRRVGCSRSPRTSVSTSYGCAIEPQPGCGVEPTGPRGRRTDAGSRSRPARRSSS